MKRHVDFHVHIYPPEVIQDAGAIAEREPRFASMVRAPFHRWATLEDLLERMDQENLERAVVCGFAFRDLGLCRLCNDYILEGVRKHPGRLSGLCAVPPLARGAMEEIERCAARGAVGVGELYPEDMDVTDREQTWRLAGTVHGAGLFVLWHTAEPVGHDYPGKGKLGPREAAAFCLNHPEVRTVFAHLGGGLWLYELMPEMRLALSNARYDLAALPWLYDASIIKAIQAAGLLDKFLFGTDFPLLSSSRYNLGSLEDERVLRLNALKLLKPNQCTGTSSP